MKFGQVFLSADGVGGAAPVGSASVTPEVKPEPTTEAEKPWYSSIEDEAIRGHAELKGWKTAADAVKSYMNAEKKLGAPADSLIRMPQQLDMESLMPIFDKLGRPAEPSGYEIPVAEGADTEFVNWFTEKAHATGLTKDQALQMASQYDEYVNNVQTAMETEAKQKAESEFLELKTEWGNQYTANEDMAKRAARDFGVDEETISLLENQVGFAKVIKIFAEIGSKLTDHKFHTGNQTGEMQMTPAAAKAEKERILTSDNEFKAKLNAGDPKAHAHWNRLMELIATG